MQNEVKDIKLFNHLVKNKDYFSCNGEGIYCLRYGNFPDYFELDNHIMTDLVDRARHEAWEKVVDDLLKDNIRLSAEYLKNKMRGDFLFALPTLNEALCALDIGSGMGGILFQLCGFYKHVVTLESSYQRLLFSRIRMQQENINNVAYINADFNKVRFKDHSFDLIVVNGVLEWIPFSYTELSPYEAQESFLIEVNDILKPGGMLYLGIENRFSKEMLLGLPDPHTGIPYTSVAPRWIANLLVYLLFNMTIKNRYYRSVKQHYKYKTYTYSYYGYKKLLKECGFSDITINIVYPSYNRPYCIVPAENYNAIRMYANYISRHPLTRRIYNIFPQLVKYLANSYAIFATKEREK